MLPFYSPNYQPYIYHYNFVISAVSYKWSHIPCHFCNWLFLLSIMPFVYSHLAEMKWTPDATFGLNVNIWFGCYAFTKRVWKCLLLTEWDFLVKAEYSPNQVQKCLRKKSRDNYLWFIMIKEWDCGEDY